MIETAAIMMVAANMLAVEAAPPPSPPSPGAGVSVELVVGVEGVLGVDSIIFWLELEFEKGFMYD